MIKIKGYRFTKTQLADAKLGAKLEMEHTNSDKLALKIAKQHEIEFSGYYRKNLIPMERKLKRMK